MHKIIVLLHGSRGLHENLLPANHSMKSVVCVSRPGYQGAYSGMLRAMNNLEDL